MGLKNILFKALSAILDFILPRSRVSRTLGDMSAADFSKKARPAKAELDGIISFYDYRDPLVKALIWQIKFKNQRNLAGLVAEAMYEPLLSELEELSIFKGFSKPILITVPLSNKRMRERGFNQCDLVAEKLGKLDSGRNFEVVQEIIRKKKDTEHQSRVKVRSKRKDNVRGCFELKDGAQVTGRNIIVFDDVATTGATIGEIKKILNDAGTRSVIGVTFAH